MTSMKFETTTPVIINQIIVSASLNVCYYDHIIDNQEMITYFYVSSNWKVGYGLLTKKSNLSKMIESTKHILDHNANSDTPWENTKMVPFRTKVENDLLYIYPANVAPMFIRAEETSFVNSFVVDSPWVSQYIGKINAIKKIAIMLLCIISQEDIRKIIAFLYCEMNCEDCKAYCTHIPHLLHLS